MSHNSIIRASEAAALALHASVILAVHPDTPLSNHSLAEKLSASDNHLSKVLQRLVRAGLVRSVRGPRGGFLLNRDPHRITLLEIYEAIDGPLKTKGCLFAAPVCNKRLCIFKSLLTDLEKQVKDYLAGTTLSQAAELE